MLSSSTRLNAQTSGGGGGGSVTSVGLSLPGIFNVSGSPVTTTGTLTGSFVSQAQNLVFASPDGSSGVPTFRTLTPGDLPPGTPTQIPYYNNSTGATTSDFAFTRDSTLFNTAILRPEGSGFLGYVLNDGSDFFHIDASYHAKEDPVTGIFNVQGVGDVTNLGFNPETTFSFVGNNTTSEYSYLQQFADPNFGLLTTVQSSNLKTTVTYGTVTGTIVVNHMVQDLTTGATGYVTAQAGSTINIGNVTGGAFGVGHTIKDLTTNGTAPITAASVSTVLSGFVMDNTVCYVTHTDESGVTSSYIIGNGKIGYKPTGATQVNFPLTQPTAGQAMIGTGIGGNTTWGTPTIPAVGTDKQVVFNNSGTNVGSNNLEFDYSTVRLFVGPQAGTYSRLSTTDLHFFDTAHSQQGFLFLDGAGGLLTLAGTSGQQGVQINDSALVTAIGDFQGLTTNANNIIVNANSGTNTITGPFTNIQSKNGSQVATFSTQDWSFGLGDLSAQANGGKFLFDGPSNIFSITGLGNNQNDRIALFDNSNRIVRLGDYDGDYNQTLLTVDDSLGTISFSYSDGQYTFPIGNGIGSLYNDGTGTMTYKQTTPSVSIVAYGSSNAYPPGDANSNIHFVVTGSTGATTFDISGMPLNSVVTVSDLDGIAATSNLTLDVGLGNTITSTDGIATSFVVNANGESVTIQKVGNSQWMVI